MKMPTTPFIPNWLYRLIGNIGWKMQARKFDLVIKIISKPDCSQYNK